jgi:putative Mg2+ transporter-C (MgtC) family protein
MEDRVKGLTTATIIWVTAALGMAIGDGHILLSFLGTMVVYIVLGLFVKLEVLMGKFGLTRNYRIVIAYSPEAYAKIERIFELCNLSVKSEKQLITPDKIVGIWSVRGRVTKHKKLIKKLMSEEDVKELEF